MQKLKSLFPEKDTRDVLKEGANIFEREKFAREHRTLSENGSNKYTTTGNPFLDDFAKLSLYKSPRDLDEIFATMDYLWAFDPLSTLRLTVFLRLITRKTVLFSGQKLSTQRGQGLKHEFLGRLLWLAHKHQDTFEKNLQYFVVAGSWKDIFDLMRYDLMYNGKDHNMLDWNVIINFILEGLKSESQTNLIKKYLPQIQCAKKCKTIQQQANSIIGKRIASKLYGYTKDEKEKAYNYHQYRKLKSTGTAHDWQQKISQGDYKSINWDTVAGRALTKLINGKFLENHNLENSFINWLNNKDIAKFTGYAYELFKDAGYHGEDVRYLYPKRYQRELVNKQFNQLIEVAKQDMNLQTGFIVALDVSGSMTSKSPGTERSAYSVGRAMALYFSELLKGKFANTFLAFSNNVVIDTFKGDTPLEKYYKGYRKYDACNTNFYQIALLFGELLKKGYPESEFPTGIICISDGEFDKPVNDWGENANDTRETVFEAFKQHLIDSGFSRTYVHNFKLVLWDIPSYYYGKPTVKFESLKDTENFFHMSGYDPAGIAFLIGNSIIKAIPKTQEELFETAMYQQLIQLLRL